MAARRVGRKVIDWAAFAERVPANQKSQFNALKSKADALKTKINTVPEKPLAINWDMYKQSVPVAGLVDKFQKEYDALKVPYPKDTATVKVNAQEKEMDQDVAKFVAESNKRIKEYEAKIEALNNMVPFEDMTVEEYEDMYPELKERKKKYPYWPHFPVWEL
ncbi:ATP synthase subunit d, mitochondrial [Holothuria leucospilota]|uniref:ATP synthase subunit d, mitochondrial n=1 Tax=Holothuria leucospilota TaxID=206669 RepID=A0A9Q1C2X8_HOLLE|nr:ATP synthase subunit d, mitochondrial [Holothuria leucospilota]